MAGGKNARLDQVELISAMTSLGKLSQRMNTHSTLGHVKLNAMTCWTDGFELWPTVQYPPLAIQC